MITQIIRKKICSYSGLGNCSFAHHSFALYKKSSKGHFALLLFEKRAKVQVALLLFYKEQKWKLLFLLFLERAKEGFALFALLVKRERANHSLLLFL